MTKANLTNVSNEDYLKWKTTFNGKPPQIWKVIYLSNYRLDLSQVLDLSSCDQTKLFKCVKWRWPQMEDNLKWKMTSNIKRDISQQPLVGSFPNFKLKLIWPNVDYLQWKTPIKRKRPQTLKRDISQQPLVRSGWIFPKS